jgi:peptidoglycan hydrolase-like protein with peptidoglycan-binding domain
MTAMNDYVLGTDVLGADVNDRIMDDETLLGLQLEDEVLGFEWPSWVPFTGGAAAPAADPNYGPAGPGASYTDAATITAVQKKLESRGYFHGVVDGKFGPVTEAAIFNFSGQHGPPDDALLTTLGIAKPGSAAPRSKPVAPSVSSAPSTSSDPYASFLPKPAAAPGAAPASAADISFWQKPVGNSGIKTWQATAIGIASVALLGGITVLAVRR